MKRYLELTTMKGGLLGASTWMKPGVFWPIRASRGTETSRDSQVHIHGISILDLLVNKYKKIISLSHYTLLNSIK